MSSTQVFMIASFFLTITGASMCTPVMNSLISQRTQVENRGRIMGAAGAMGAWGRVVGPIVAGALLSYGSFGIAWAFGVLVGLLYIAWPVNELKNNSLNADLVSNTADINGDS